MKTTCHPQKSGQAEKFIIILIVQLRHYTAELQRDSDISLEPVTYAYNTQISHWPGTTTLSLVLSRHLLIPETMNYC